jgi:hypothetical protein
MSITCVEVLVAVSYRIHGHRNCEEHAPRYNPSLCQTPISSSRCILTLFFHSFLVASSHPLLLNRLALESREAIGESFAVLVGGVFRQPVPC